MEYNEKQQQAATKEPPKVDKKALEKAKKAKEKALENNDIVRK